MDEIGQKVAQNKGVRSLMKHHRKTDCCCFCLSSKQGALIIGIGLCVGLLEEIRAPNPVRAVLKVIGLVPFFMMLAADSAWHRQLFLFAFCLTVPLVAVVNLVSYQNILVDNVSFASELCWLSKKWYATMGGNKEQDEAVAECENADEDEQADCEANLDQCPMLPGGALKVLFVITPIVVIMNVHFAFVLYTHYRNSKLPEEQGGCADDNGPAYADQIDDE